MRFKRYDNLSVIAPAMDKSAPYLAGGLSLKSAFSMPSPDVSFFPMCNFRVIISHAHNVFGA